MSITSYVQPSVIPPYRKLEACKGRSAGNDKTTPFLRRVKSMWAHRLLRKAYCEFSGEGCVCCLFLQEKNGAKVSYQTLSIINRHTHPPSLTHRSPGCMRSDEDGVHARSGAASVVFFEYPIRIGCFRHTNLSQDSGKPRGGSGICPWNPSLRTISPKVQTKKQQPAIRSGLLLYSPSGFGCCLRFPI